MARLLSLDLGERRIGVAICDPTGTLARPLTTIHRASRREDFDAIAELVSSNEVERIIVGLPLSLDGAEGPQARRVKRYADRLAQAVDVPLEFWDERYSSQEAAEILGKTGRKQRDVRNRIDATAAAVILQSYLDAHARSDASAVF
jgi:putative Holliday junction resolvase